MKFRLLWILLFIGLAQVWTPASRAMAVPEGLSASDWSQIQAQLQAARFHAQPADDPAEGWRARNPAHGFQIDYGTDGRTVLTLQGDHPAAPSIALQLEGYGYGEQLIERIDAPLLSANGQTVTYQWKPGLREWWVNSARGVEQWFELAERPAVSANGQPLVVAMRLDTALQVEVNNSVLHLSSVDGSTNITYDRLKVWDATGRVLPAEMVLNDDRLALQVDDTNAVYPVTIDPTFAQQAYLKASGIDADDQFGWSVAISDDTVVVGAWREASAATGINGDSSDNSAGLAGAAYVFVRDGSDNWSQQAYLKASNNPSFGGIGFGWSVAIDGNTVVVGAPFEPSAATGVNGDQTSIRASASGAAYVFERDAANVWFQRAYLKASNTNIGDQFGESVAISGDTIVVGAPSERSLATGVDGNQNNNDGFFTGAAYVFERDGMGDWMQTAYLKSPDNTTSPVDSIGDIFARSVAVDGDTIVVGAAFEDSNATTVNGDFSNNDLSSSGAAYVYAKNAAGLWGLQAYLKASNAESGDAFGNSVSIDGDSIVVGALIKDSSEGAAYVFVRDGSDNWSQQAFLKASNPDRLDQFGTSVSIAGNTIAVSAFAEDSAAIGADGNESNNSGTDAGAVYVFTREAGVWSQQAYLKASNTGVDDFFGWSVATTEDTVVVGAIGESSSGMDQLDDSAPSAGASYVFTVSSALFSIRGIVSDLQGSGLVLQNNGGDDLSITTDDMFTFPTALVDGSAYNVTVATQPTNPSQTCTVTNGTGTLAGADVTNVQVTCTTDTFTVSGNVAGLEGDEVVLQNNGGDDQVLTADDGFTFTAQNDDTGYAVTVLTQPTNPSQTCTVTNGTGTLAGADVTNVQVTCVTDTFTVGGTVSGLATGNSVTLINNGGDAQTVSGDVPFTFSPQNDATAYNVTVQTQPTGPSQTCTVTNGTGTLAGADVTNVQVTCATDTFTVGGNVAGLEGDQVVLQNNGGDDQVLTADDGFTFTAQNDDTGYAVTVLTQPTNPSQTCTVTNGTGTLAGANVTNVQVTCTTDTFNVGGNVSGLTGTGLVLQNNGGDDLPITTDDMFTFPTSLDDGNGYVVTVATQPTNPSQTCAVTNGTGNLSGADVTDVQITCVTDQFTVGGTVTGLADGNNLIVQNNTSDDLIVTADGPFTFATALDDGSAYAVTVLTQPTGPNQTCTVTNGTGALAGADVTDVQVTCVTDTFTIGGTVTGLTGTGLVLQNNGGDDLPVTSAGPFTFATPIDDGSDYAITVVSQPQTARDQQCTVSNASGTVMGADIDNVTVQCQDILIEVSVTDLDLGLVLLGSSGSATITLSNTGQPDLTITDISSPSAPFALTGGDCLNLPITLAAGQSCQIELTFSPTEIGTFDDSLQITSNATTSPDTVNLSGTASLEPLIVPTLNTAALLALILLLSMIGAIASRRVSRG